MPIHITRVWRQACRIVVLIGKSPAQAFASIDRTTSAKPPDVAQAGDSMVDNEVKKLNIRNINRSNINNKKK
ncbi:MAG: hypothetical protein BGO34_09070 [Bacteroidia bacterium 44-10]|jgi:hypothetical protein|nr:MAG: hypothetical protein BGO34_09070 [Bacteroidia bacterium 44-10]